ncbi:unnamed protein product [Adineta ricciae]|uniref:Uncharacterized protein n=1 Tax=Adineta ricciae TaxID=249248 RepID=A0A813VAP7_ADIRI|nr:unnamed protein product [Adineta ricciae]
MLRIKSILLGGNNVSVQDKFVPLKEVHIEGKIHSFAADVTIKQIFRNDENNPIEAVYCFPIEEQAAVYKFIAQIDDRQIEAELKEKKQAQQDYNNALQQGRGAYLLEQNEQSQDNFIVNIGALLPGKECHITISYVTELNLIDNGNKIHFVIPTTIAPRYNPSQGGISSPARTNSEYVQTTPYTIDFQCQIDKTNVSSVSSTSHPIQIEFNQQDYYLVKFSQNETHLDRDILLDIHLNKQRSNTILAIESNALMISFTPNEQDCQRAMNNVEVTNEFVFIVDCSGSMQDENKIGYARQSMVLFLKSLPLNSHFNIIRFGSSYKPLFDQATDLYNEENSKKAEQLVNNMQADLGGTELLNPMKWLEEHPAQEGRSRQIFLLTDGEISNVDEVLNLCRSMSKSSRIFSFGLGQSPSRSLVKGLARSTNGRFCFIPPSTKVDTYVGQQLEKALQPSITNLEIKWNLPIEIATAPKVLPPVYANDRLIIYGLINDPTIVFDHQIRIELFNNQQKLSEATITQIPAIIQNQTISRLAGKALILELQHSKLPSIPKGSRQTRFRELNQQSIDKQQEEQRERIINLSLKYQILSPHTSFIGIEKRLNGNNEQMVLREVPIQISADDQHLVQPAPTNGAFMQCASSMRSPLSHMFASMASHKDRSDRRGRHKKPISNYLGCYSSRDISLHCAKQIACMYDAFEIDESRKVFLDDDEESEEKFPNDDENIVRYLIDKQNFDGLWNLDSEIIEKLTGKPLKQFQYSLDDKLIVSIIIVILLETRFSSYSSMCHGMIQKSKKQILNLLNKDQNHFESLFQQIQKQL